MSELVPLFPVLALLICVWLVPARQRGSVLLALAGGRVLAQPVARPRRGVLKARSKA